MRILYRIILGLIACLYMGLYGRHVCIVNHIQGEAEMPYAAEMEVWVKGENKYRESCSFMQYGGNYVFSPRGIGAKSRLTTLIQRHAGEEALFSFRKNNTVIKEGSAILPKSLSGFYIIYSESHEAGETRGKLTSADEL